VKLRIAAIMLITVLTAAAFALPVSAVSVKMSDEGFSVEVPDEYTVLTASNLSKNKDFLTGLGHTSESFRRSMDEADIVMYAATADNRRQMQVKIWTSDFSELTGDLSQLSGEAAEQALASIGGDIGGSGQLLDSQQIIRGEMRFFRFTVRVDGGLPFCYIQYLTVLNGKFYSLVYYNAESSLTAEQQSEAEAAFNSFTVQKQRSVGIVDGNTLLQIVIGGIVIAAAAALAVYLIVSLYRDIKNRGSEPDIIPERIKMKRK
jgi:hypothetical protein